MGNYTLIYLLENHFPFPVITNHNEENNKLNTQFKLLAMGPKYGYPLLYLCMILPSDIKMQVNLNGNVEHYQHGNEAEEEREMEQNASVVAVVEKVIAIENLTQAASVLDGIIGMQGVFRNHIELAVQNLNESFGKYIGIDFTEVASMSEDLDEQLNSLREIVEVIHTPNLERSKYFNILSNLGMLRATDEWTFWQMLFHTYISSLYNRLTGTEPTAPDWTTPIDLPEVSKVNNANSILSEKEVENIGLFYGDSYDCNEYPHNWRFDQ